MQVLLEREDAAPRRKAGSLSSGASIANAW